MNEKYSMGVKTVNFGVNGLRFMFPALPLRAV